MPPTGYLRVRTFTSRAMLPIKDVTVTIEQELGEDRKRLLSVQQTDESGLIQTIAVETPAEANSLRPDQAKGWTDVIVRAGHPLYESITVEDVQVFPGITTEQELEMIPLAELPEDWNKSEYFRIAPQSL